ncbi:MAG: hypothetical protein O2807_10270, partial [bacterium]|nr:hypothetical protein [bacterium]
PVSFKLKRRLDDLASNGVGQQVVETLLKQVWKKLTDLSGKAGDLVGKELKGVLKGLGKKSPKAQDVIKDLGRELERGLQDILRRR